MPNGVGAVNQKGVDFYDRLVDEIPQARHQAAVHGVHWDYPQPLYKRGGWLHRDSADWFAEYVAFIGEKLGESRQDVGDAERAPVLHRPGAAGRRARPGDKLKFPEYLTAAHNAMRAHAKGVQALRAPTSRTPRSATCWPRRSRSRPATRPRTSTRRSRLSSPSTRRDPWRNSWWTDRWSFGRYPEDGLAFFGKDMPKFKPSDWTR